MKRTLIAGAVLLLGTMTIVPAGARVPRLAVFNSSDGSVPTSVRGLSAAPRIGTPVAIARAHLAENTHLYRFPDVTSLRVLEEIRNPGTHTVRFGQSIDGIPVFGAQYLVHLVGGPGRWSPSGTNGHLFPELRVDTTPRLSRAIALRLAKLRSVVYPLDRTEYHGLTILPEGEGMLTYHFTLWGQRYGVPARYEVYIGAHNGRVGLAYNNMKFAHVEGSGTNSHGVTVPLNVSQQGSRFELLDERPGTTGIISTHDAQGSIDYKVTDSNIATSSSSTFSGVNSASGAVDAHWGAGKTYDFFLALGRNSIDDRGGTIYSTVNISDPQFGGPYTGAFWDGTQMAYGNPNPAELHPFSGDLDVVAHELTHGVTEHTADLVYLNQPGAMNEAISDYFGNAIDVTNSAPQPASDAGRVGEDLCKVPNPSGWRCPIRDLNDGRTTDSYIYELTDSDNGGVHDNSTIYGGALWDIREALGARADQFVYKALAEFMTPLDKFIDGREAVVAAAQTLGATESELAAVKAAFDAKGITPGWDDLPPASDSRIVARDILEYGYYDRSGPDLSGNRFVYSDYPDKTKTLGAQQVLLGDLTGTTPKEVGEFNNSSTLSDEQPAISGRKIAWVHITLSGQVDIHWRKIGGSLRKIPAPGQQIAPDVDGRTIVWQDMRGTTADIWMKRGTAKPRKLVGGRAEQWNPQVDGNYVVWWQPGFSGPPAIGIKNIKTGKKDLVKLERPEAVLSAPAAGGGAAAWYEDADGDGLGAIRYVKLGSSKVRTLVSETDPGAPRWLGGFTPPPVVSTNGTWVAYSDETNLTPDLVDRPPTPADRVGRDVYVVAISGGTATSVTGNRGDQAYPSLGSGSTLIWLDAAAGTTDVATNN